MSASGLEWFAAWKNIDGCEVVTDDFALGTLIKGLLVPKDLLSYIMFYIFHELDKGKLLKKERQIPPVFRYSIRLAEN